MTPIMLLLGLGARVQGARFIYSANQSVFSNFSSRGYLAVGFSSYDRVAWPLAEALRSHKARQVKDHNACRGNQVPRQHSNRKPATWDDQVK